MLRAVAGICLLTIPWGKAYAQSTGSIEGRVLDAASGRGVREARLVVGSTEPGGRRDETETDTSGSYRFAGLEAGSYSLSVSKAGYGRNEFALGRSSCRRVLTLGTGEQIKDADFRLSKPGLITGRVRDAEHQPVAGARVSAMAARELTGEKLVLPVGSSARTDDRGEFRLYDLPQGRYYLKVLGPTQPIVFQPGGGALKAPKTRVEFLPAYYPSVEDLSQALRVTVRGGQELAGIDVQLETGEVFAITGRVPLPDGAAGSSTVWVWLEAADKVDAEPQHVLFDPAGQFRFGSVRPGPYRITAYQVGQTGRILAGSTELLVRDRDPEDLAIQLSAGPEVRGVVREEDGKPLAAEVAKRIKAFLVPRRQDPGVPRPAPAALGQDGRFSVPDVPPGQYWVRLVGIPDQYYVKRIQYGKLDVMETRLFSLAPGVTLDIEVSPKAGSVVATIRDPDGNAVGQALVVAERDGKTADGKPVRLPRQADQHGVVRMSGLPPATYRLYAFEGGDEALIGEADFSRFSSQAATVELSPGGQSSIDLRVLAPEP